MIIMGSSYTVQIVFGKSNVTALAHTIHAFNFFYMQVDVRMIYDHRNDIPRTFVKRPVCLKRKFIIIQGDLYSTHLLQKARAQGTLQ